MTSCAQITQGPRPKDMVIHRGMKDKEVLTLKVLNSENLLVTVA